MRGVGSSIREKTNTGKFSEGLRRLCASTTFDSTASMLLVLASSDSAKGVATYARDNGITQIYVTRNAPHVQKLVQLAKDIQVTIVAERVR